MKSAMERYERAKEAADEALNAMRGAKRHQFMVAALNCQTNEREGEISYEGAHLEWIIAELAFTSAFVALTYARKAQAEREEVKNDDITH